MQSSYSNISLGSVTVNSFNLRHNIWSHCFNSPESKAQVRYDNEYINDLLSLSVHISKEVYISSCDQMSCKAHKLGERLWKGIGLIIQIRIMPYA